jgi:hypothetical protein
LPRRVVRRYDFLVHSPRRRNTHEHNIGNNVGKRPRRPFKLTPQTRFVTTPDQANVKAPRLEAPFTLNRVTDIQTPYECRPPKMRFAKSVNTDATKISAARIAVRLPRHPARRRACK